jgi:hypothetical protein
MVRRDWFPKRDSLIRYNLLAQGPQAFYDKLNAITFYEEVIRKCYRSFELGVSHDQRYLARTH